MAKLFGQVRSIRAMLVAAGLLWAPSIARACAVCTAGRDEENAFAFLMTTIFMSLMPLAAIGLVVFVLWRRMQKLEAEQAAREPASAGAGVSRAAESPR